ncbi:MAG TPA: APC family permease [Candidatus Angelobacter sp.]
MMKNHSNPSRKLTVLPLVAATYFMVSGGPSGIEEIVQDSGYTLAIVILLATPLIWSLPTSLMVGELSAAIPAEGGFYVWVRRAMGRFWGFQEAWLSLAASLFDMASYPALFVLSLAHLWPPANQGHNGVFIASGVVLSCVLWNLFGSRAVGNGSILLGALLLAPFIAIIAFAIFHHGSLHDDTATTGPHGDWMTAVIVAMWNYMGWDNASTIAGEVDNPQKTYPKVMMLSLGAIVLSYVIPVGIVASTHIQSGFWSQGSWSEIASLLGGKWLGFALVVGSMISTFGIVNSLTMSYSRLPAAMAEEGDMPRFFARKLESGTPWVSVVICGLAWIAVVFALGTNLDRLLLLDILLYGSSLVLEFVALVVLRIREPMLHRPFRVPGGLVGAILAGVGPTIMLATAFMKNREEHLGSISTLMLGGIFIIAGVVLYFLVAWLVKSKSQSESRN